MKNKTILFVEDEEVLLDIAMSQLKKHFNVIGAANGSDAWEHLQAHRLDCLILDLEMPGMGDLELLSKIRGNGDYTPVIIVTGKSCRDYAEQSADLGVSGYMTKPYNMVDLIERVKNVISQSGRVEEKANVIQQEMHPKLQEVLEHINEHYPRGLSAGSVSKETGISYGHLADLFKKEIGMSFTCYLNRLRVGKAKKLIKSTDIPLSQIMADVGFKTEQHFFKQFKRFAGVTPRSLRGKA